MTSFLVHVLPVVLLLVLQLVRSQFEWVVKRKLLVSNGEERSSSSHSFDSLAPQPARPEGSPRRSVETWRTPFGPQLLAALYEPPEA